MGALLRGDQPRATRPLGAASSPRDRGRERSGPACSRRRGRGDWRRSADSDAVGILKPLASEDTGDSALAALRVLGTTRSDGVVATLRDAIRSPDAARGWQRSRHSPAGVARRRSSRCSGPRRPTADPSVVRAAFAGLAHDRESERVGSRSAVRATLKNLSDPARRDDALAVLGRLAPSAIPFVAESLSADDPHLRRGVVEVLGRLTHPAASACLQKALSDADAVVRREAVRALSRIGTRGLGHAASRRWRETDLSPAVREAAAAALSRHSGVRRRQANEWRSFRKIWASRQTGLPLLRDLIHDRVGLIYDNGRCELLSDRLAPLVVAARVSIVSRLLLPAEVRRARDRGRVARRHRRAVGAGDVLLARDRPDSRARAATCCPSSSAVGGHTSDPHLERAVRDGRGTAHDRHGARGGRVVSAARRSRFMRATPARVGDRQGARRPLPRAVVSLAAARPAREVLRRARRRRLRRSRRCAPGSPRGASSTSWMPGEVRRTRSSPVIFCRNAFIYFSPQSVRRVVRTFAETMPTPGFLFVGASESLVIVTDRFMLEDLERAFVYVKR